MKIILKTGKEVGTALKFLAKEFEKRDLSQVEVELILKSQGLDSLAQEVRKMEPQEFEDWVLNHFL